MRQVMWWHRNRNAQHLFAVLAGVVGVAPAARKHRFRVRAWAGTRPVDVAVRPPKGWVPGTQVDEIAAAYTAATGTRGFAVHRRGWIRVSPHRDLGGGQADITDPDESPTPDARSRVEDRVRDVLLPLVGGDGRVTITDWWDRTNPRALTFAYASAAARNARAARNELGVLLADVCPPRARNGRWAVQWDAAADRFHARDEPDPLSPVVVPAPMTSDLDLVAGPIIGVTEAGDPWRLPLLGSHVLVAGATGAGKGSVLWGLIRGVLPLIGDGRVKLWVIDPKGGMELGAMESIAYRFATADGAADLLAEAAEVMEDQAQRLRASGRRKLETPTQGFPLHLVVVDELAALTSLAPEPRVRNAMNATMGRLLTQGRAVGFTVVGALQDPRQKNLDNRNLFPVAVALRLKEPQMVDMVLGAGSRTAGALCDMIPRALPGVAYVVADGQAETMRVRAAFVSDDEVARMTTPPTPPPAHTPVVVGEQLALPDAVGVVGVNRVKPGDKVLLPGDPNQVTVVGVGPDPDEPDDRTEVVYRYDGEHVDRVASFDRDDAFRVAP